MMDKGSSAIEGSRRHFGDSIVTRFESIARRFPGRVALASDAWQSTYSELNNTADRWAQDFTALGGLPGDRAVVLMRHDAPIIAAVLAVLKAGRIVVVLNPTDPLARLRQSLEHCDPSLIVTDSANADRTGQLSTDQRRVYVVDRLAARHSTPSIDLRAEPDDIAYIIYTSGSTGRAKGVMQSHRNLLHQVDKYTLGIGLRPDDRIALFATLGSGQGMSTAWGTLLNGAALYPFQIMEKGVATLADWLDEHRITVCICATSLFRSLMSAMPVGRRLPHVRIVRLGAESATNSDVEAFRNHFADDCTLIHTFSSSETGNVTQHKLKHGDVVEKGRLPVGRPAIGMDVSIVDAQGRRVATGEIGEIVVRSEFLSPGYWRDETLTAKHFFADGSLNDMRCFRGGDLGCLRADGSLIHMGRNDHQIKLSGHRIDLGEIEATLNQCPGVHHNAVLSHGTAGQDSILVAFVVADSETRLDGDQLRTFVAGRLPPYMVPKRVIQLNQLPLLPNGKINRPTLLQSIDDDVSHAAPVEPRTDTERKLATIWSHLLNVDGIGIANDFFGLGGRSLLAVQLMNQIEAEFKKNLSVTTLFEHPTIEKLARILDDVAHDVPSEVVAIQPHGSKPPVFFAHGLGGELTFAHVLARHLGADQPIYGLQSVDYGLVRFQDIAGRLVDAIRRVQPHGPYRLVGYCFGGMLAFEIAQQLRQLGCEVEVLALLDARFTPAKRSLLNRANLALRFIKNLPFRLAGVLVIDPPDRLLLRSMDRLRLLQREILATLRREPVRRRLHDAHDVDRIRPADQARWQRDHDALQNYHPLPYDDRLVLLRSHTRPLFRGLDHDLGWSFLVRKGLDVRVVPGHHARMIDEPQISHIASILAAELDGAPRSGE
jgi:amino acid adenylation domain-containing protein